MNDDMKTVLDQWNALKAAKAEPCPSCGHCPTCGRGGHQVAPWVIPMPYVQPYPWWQQPWYGTTTVICETGNNTSSWTMGQ